MKYNRKVFFMYERKNNPRFIERMIMGDVMHSQKTTTAQRHPLYHQPKVWERCL